ncbi:hypothetical protein HYALB_00004894 [Hymenoscyphus albidus]|uniref:Uncharacterized protein n=1 Tax=Hymenoscyphus albidus TaxID=595503 RepID=A0A9N9PXS1_9HELO|nr:hypothetical protein HYALB_00004894 [Hymenoscyphus albidus]
MRVYRFFLAFIKARAYALMLRARIATCLTLVKVFRDFFHYKIMSRESAGAILWSRISSLRFSRPRTWLQNAWLGSDTYYLSASGKQPNSLLQILKVDLWKHLYLWYHKRDPIVLFNVGVSIGAGLGLGFAGIMRKRSGKMNSKDRT